jgi:hypothetical protein
MLLLLLMPAGGVDSTAAGTATASRPCAVMRADLLLCSCLPLVLVLIGGVPAALEPRLHSAQQTQALRSRYHGSFCDCQTVSALHCLYSTA